MPSARAPARRPAIRLALPDGERGRLLVAALSDRFNLAVLGVLLAVGIALDTVALMVPMALAVYAAGVARSYLDREGRADG
jgi:hypothetical protein